ncbi:16532_t:CDS:2, partial [Acaulospora colombiana]
ASQLICKWDDPQLFPRSYFARALLEPPFDPLNSPYARSVFASYASACVILATQFWALLHPAPQTACLRPLLSLILVRTIFLEMINSEPLLDRAVELFQHARAGKRIARGLVRSKSLLEKAHKAINSFRSGTWTRPTATDSELYKSFGSSGIIVVPKSSPESTPDTNSDATSATNSFSENSLASVLGTENKQSSGYPETTVLPGLGTTTSDGFLQSIFGNSWVLGSSLDKALEPPDSILSRHSPSLTSPESQITPYPMSGSQPETQGQNIKSTGPAILRTVDEVQGISQVPIANTSSSTLSFNDPQASILWEAFLREKHNLDLTISGQPLTQQNYEQNMAENVNHKQSEHSRAKNCAEYYRYLAQTVSSEEELPYVPTARFFPKVNGSSSTMATFGGLSDKIFLYKLRLILSNTEQLHVRIDELTERIRELEEALANLQSLHSDEPHPLLKESTEPLTTAFGSLRLHDDLMSNDGPAIDPVPQVYPSSDLSQSVNPLEDAGGLDFVNASFPHSRHE